MQNTPEGALELLTQTLVKLDAELRAAQQLPPGAVQEQAVAAIQEQIRQTARAYSEGTPAARRTMAAQQHGDQLNLTAWPEGKPKPKLQTEQEIRPESTYRTPEEEDAL